MNKSNASFNFPFRPAVSFQHIMQGKHKNYDRLRISLSLSCPLSIPHYHPFYLSPSLYLSNTYTPKTHKHIYNSHQTEHQNHNNHSPLIIGWFNIVKFKFVIYIHKWVEILADCMKYLELVRLGMEWSWGTLSGSEGGWPTARSVGGPPFGTGAVLRVVLCWP